MPHPEIERLAADSDSAQVKAATSACIAREVNGGTPQDQAVAMCNGMVKQQIGGSNA